MITEDQRAEGTMRLIYTLRSNGVTDSRILDAIERTPREFFLDRAFQDRAFDDIPPADRMRSDDFAAIYRRINDSGVRGYPALQSAGSGLWIRLSGGDPSPARPQGLCHGTPSPTGQTGPCADRGASAVQHPDSDRRRIARLVRSGPVRSHSFDCCSGRSAQGTDRTAENWWYNGIASWPV